MKEWVKKPRTWSRQVGFILLVFLCVLAYQEKTDELEILAWPFITFAGLAFGFKQPSIDERLRRTS